MSEKKWIFLNKNSDSALAGALASELSVPPIVASVLVNRNIKTSCDAKAFLTKSRLDTHHPFLMKDAEKAARRLLDAIRANEKIVIYGDYDVDGITATAIMYRFLKSLGADVSYYIPNRADEGYGINTRALSGFARNGIGLVITVDCGITAIDEIEFAKTIGLDFIVTDHHTCKEKIPCAYAVMNPKQNDCGYPFVHLAGVGVAFNLILATALVSGENARKYYDMFIDIVAIGTIADVVSLTGENRLFVSDGLKKLQTTDNKGLLALFSTASINSKPISAGTVSFSIAPRINAAGRIGSAELAVELLVTDDENRAKTIAQKLEDENKTRQETELRILGEAIDMIEHDPKKDEKKVFVLAKEGWHQGVIGIVASRIVDRYHKPAILISLNECVGKGSGRSVRGFNLFDALSFCSALMTKYGGHELAAGLGIMEDNIEEFDETINKYAAENMSRDANIASINIDFEVFSPDITIKNAQALSLLEPFGMNNPQPIFALKNTHLVSCRLLSSGKHCKLTVSLNGRQFEFLGFGMGDKAERFVIGDRLDIAFTMDTNSFRGETQLQLVIKDIRFSIK